MKLAIPRLSREDMIKLVQDRLSCKVMFSDEVPEGLIPSVFMPVAFGALDPSTETIASILGISAPPESLPGEPQKPKHPGYPKQVGDPPNKPVLTKLPEKERLDLEWGYISEEDLVELREAIDKENQDKIKAWEEATWAWMAEVDKDSRIRRERDVEYELSVKAWEESLSKHAEAVAQREALKKDWQARYAEHFSEWYEDIGVICGDASSSFPRSINGFPIFSSIRVIHKDDWERVRAALVRESKREIEI